MAAALSPLGVKQLTGLVHLGTARHDAVGVVARVDEYECVGDGTRARVTVLTESEGSQLISVSVEEVGR
jgi:hypothetical protein